ncbi:MAG TPA: O-antigen ligase family protein [Burkholderiales bacterium]
MAKPGVSQTSLGFPRRPVEAAAIRSRAAGEAGRQQHSRGPVLSAALFASALVASLLFNGVHGEWFGLALALLTLWLLSVAWRAPPGPRSPAGVLPWLLGLYWMWLGFTLLRHPVPQMGIAYFWVLGTLPLTFFGSLTEAEGEAPWSRLFGAALAVAILLAAWSFWQFFGLHAVPRSAFLDANSHAGVLNLVALPAAGAWLARGDAVQDARGRMGLVLGATVLLLLFFAVFLTKGRAAGLSLALGLALILFIGARRLPRRTLLLAVLAGTAFAAANAAGHGEVAQRLQTLFTPASAGADRFVIWRQAWSMLGENPWTGVGIGTLWLRWPVWRAPEDMSAGFFVHNDYLQLWLEAGIIAPLLLAAALAVALAGAARALSRATPRPMELAGLAAAVLALALHGFFNFNLYQLPILIFAGALLARLHRLSRPAATVSAPGLVTADASRRRRVLACALALPMLAYFGSQAAGAHLYRRGVEEARQGRYAAADATLLAAGRMTPLADNVLTSHADLMRRLGRALPPGEAGHRAFLYRSATDMLIRARALNPYRAENPLILGRLVEDNPQLFGPGWGDEALRLYGEALRLNPRQYEARTALARLLVERGEREAALRVAEAGLRYWHPATPDIAAYYELVQRLRREAGDVPGSEEMAARLRVIREAGAPLDTAWFDPARATDAAGEAAPGAPR